MNSKEALENLTYCVNGMESKEKYYKIIKQDLERLEKLEQENNSLRAFVSNLQFCRERETKELEKLENKNQVLREKVNHFKNVKNRMRRNCKFYEKENIKLQKVIEILKNKQVHIVILLECIKANGGVELYNACVEKPYQLTQEEYDLLKEVIINEK